MTQQLRVLYALLEDKSLVSSTHVGKLTTAIDAHSRDSASSGK